ncbi:hypothetical protein RF11_12174 [Thelohanellus kitauei]|uniref:Uncharacterized protein n=1 Tax=Thelohanellus kitauei TaxID=669202 RepID=A0A0C2MF09_THEKT|nr:hypothetical protein RF11_12174 [Thelohanellus kitauei]
MRCLWKLSAFFATRSSEDQNKDLTESINDKTPTNPKETAYSKTSETKRAKTPTKKPVSSDKKSPKLSDSHRIQLVTKKSQPDHHISNLEYNYGKIDPKEYDPSKENYHHIKDACWHSNEP